MVLLSLLLGRIAVLRMQMRPLVADRVALSVCQSVTLMSPAKTAEPIEMPLEFGLSTRVGPMEPIQIQIPHRRGNF